MKLIRQAIPTNIITGFLGVGKTTTILSLLKRKPAQQRWAVLVNEFGEIGIDGALLQAQSGHAAPDENGSDNGIVIKEVPGGCLCCAAGVSLQVALSRLIRQAKPQHLLIEPTGLGHPLQILKMLRQPVYAGVLDVRSTITVVDARQMQDKRYRDHDIYQQQLQVADVIIANKTDLYQADDLEFFTHYLAHNPLLKNKIIVNSQSISDLSILDRVPHLPQHKLVKPLQTLSLQEGIELTDDEINNAQQPGQLINLPASGYLRKGRSADGYTSCGWVFAATQRFDFDALNGFFTSITAERLKAVVNTQLGRYSFNKTGAMLTRVGGDAVVNDLGPDDRPALQSRIEIISDIPFDEDDIEQQLLSSRIN